MTDYSSVNRIEIAFLVHPIEKQAHLFLNQRHAVDTLANVHDMLFATPCSDVRDDKDLRSHLTVELVAYLTPNAMQTKDPKFIRDVMNDAAFSVMTPNGKQSFRLNKKNMIWIELVWQTISLF